MSTTAFYDFDEEYNQLQGEASEMRMRLEMIKDLVAKWGIEGGEYTQQLEHCLECDVITGER